MVRHLTIVFLFLIQASCGSSNEFAPSGDGDGGDGDGDGDGPSGQGGGAPGVLTAAMWDDNLNFDLFQEAHESFFADFIEIATLPTVDRVELIVTDSRGLPVSNALATIYDESRTYLVAPTGTDGRLSFFPSLDGAEQAGPLRVEVTTPGGVTTDVAVSGPEWRIELENATPRTTAADVAFIVDATGSMADEIGYLQAEIRAIANRVAKIGERKASLRFALIVYRDRGDAYVTRQFDFADLNAFSSAIAEQDASGGGDYPEAMETALEEGTELSWREGNVARIAFLIADAPPHDEDVGAALAAVNSYRRAGVRLYPVAASGVAGLAEYVMRLGATITRGRYIFITDDSGVGNAHAEPHIPCYEVELLGNLMTRVIDSELRQEMRWPDKDSIIRESGVMFEGKCLEPKQPVAAGGIR